MSDHIPIDVHNSSEKRETVDPNLFRLEALDAATSRFGSPVKPTGLAGWSLTIFLVLVFLCVAMFLVIGRYTRKETVSGILQPTAGATRVTSPGQGVISQVFVQEGQTVRVGDPILQLSTDQSVSDGEGGRPTALSNLVQESADREALALAQQAVAKSQADARALDDLSARRLGLVEDQAQLKQSAELQEQRIRLAQETLDAGKSLHERQLFSTLQLRQREEALISARQGLASINRETRRNIAALQQLQTEEERLAAERDQSTATVALAQAQFDQRQAQRRADRATVLVAGRSGKIVALQARPGASVLPGRALAIILPEGATLQAELWVPSRAAGFLAVGNRVRLLYDPFPYQKFGVGHGTVASIAGAPTDPADLTVPIEAREALYRIAVDLDEDSVDGYGKRWRLTPGMRVTADLVLDDRSLWEWLFDPVIAARRRSAA